MKKALLIIGVAGIVASCSNTDSAKPQQGVGGGAGVGIGGTSGRRDRRRGPRGAPLTRGRAVTAGTGGTGVQVRRSVVHRGLRVL